MMPLPDQLKIIFAIIFCINSGLIWCLTRPLIPWFMWKIGMKPNLKNLWRVRDCHTFLCVFIWLVSIASIPFWR